MQQMQQMEQPPMGPDAGQVMDQMRSPMNPADMAAMSEQGPQIDPSTTTVRQLMEMQGINVDGPVSQLIEKVQEMEGNADMGNKMEAMAGAPPAPNPMTAKMQQGGMPPGGGGSPGLDDILGGGM